MSNWKDFEKECFEYLKSNKPKDTDYNLYGGSNSHIADIGIINTINSKYRGFIECKMPTAQSGQFVVSIKDDKFIYSSGNQDEENMFSKMIVDYLNKHMDYFGDVNTNGKNIDLIPEYLSLWIEHHYKHKNVTHVITKINNDFVLFPLSEINKYFSITACLRRKKSGSRELPAKDFSLIEEYLKSNKISYTSFYKDGKKYYIDGIELEQEKIKFTIGQDNYQLSKQNSLYEVRKLGKTENPTVVFSIKLKECV